MNDFVNATCDKDAVSCLYNIFLGRNPEDDHPWIGVPKLTVIKAIVGSDEFESACYTVLHSGLDNLFVHRDADAARLIPQFLAEMGAPPPRSDTWPDFLLSGLEALKALVDLDDVPQVAHLAASIIRSDYKAKLKEVPFLADLIRFDEEWFFKANKSASGLLGTSISELRSIVALMVIDGEAEISPFFHIAGAANRDLRLMVFGVKREAADFTLDDVLSLLRLAFRRNRLSHWLFRPKYYVTQRERAFAENRVNRWVPDADPYTDFLTNGDRENIRPHPLFCPTAYATLNPDLEQDCSLFRHFVTSGQFEERRTSALFDPAYYQTMNPTIRLQINDGTYRSLLESFCVGYCDRDVHFLPDFDQAYYQATYPDVKPDGSHVTSVAQHFIRFGVAEGRNPNPYFDTAYFGLRYPWLGERCRKLAVSMLEYFLLIGRHNNMRAARPLADRSIDMLQAKALYERRSKDTHIRLRRNPLDFTALGGDSPVLSVIVPVHNQADFTARFLELAFYGAAELKRRVGRSMEVIVVSNGSTDATAELLAATSGIKHVSETKALGYPGAANIGAALATGELVLFTNNDIEFEPGVFADLVASYFRIPDCGAIGPRILSMDMTVQEIGAFIAGDGSTFGFGRGERSTYNAIGRAEQVDYVSGCFLCLSRMDFERLGGFDEAFSPGYYEEVDLCLRLEKACGKSVFVDPGITITHYEHASFTKGRPATVSYPAILRNRKYLLRKHPDVGSRPGIDKIMSTAGLAQLGLAKSRVLVIEDLVPDSRLGSGFGRAAEVLRVFHELGVAYDVVALNPTMKIDDYEFSDVTLYRHWMPGESVEAVLNRSPGLYSHIWVCRSHNLARLHDLFRRNKDVWNTQIICDTEAVSVQRTIGLARLQGQPPSEAEVIDLVAAEFNNPGIVDRFIAVNQRDLESLKSVGLQHVSIISHTVSGVVRSTRPWKDRTRLLFVGAVHSPLAPNFDSIKWFLRGSARMIEQQGKRLTLAGYWDENILREFSRNNSHLPIDFLGMVSEQRLSELYEEAIVAIAPTRYSAGIPCKVIEAMLTGTPIAMTQLLADQIGVSGQARNRLAVARTDPEGVDFCQAVRRLIEDESWWNTVRDMQIEYAESRFSHDTFNRDVRRVLKEVGVSWAYEEPDPHGPA